MFRDRRTMNTVLKVVRQQPMLTFFPFLLEIDVGGSPVALQLRAPPKVSARAPAHRSYHFRGVKLKSCIKKIHHNLYISKQANVRIKHADTEGASHKKFGTDARVQQDIYADTAKRK